MDQNPIADIADTIISRQRNSRIPFRRAMRFLRRARVGRAARRCRRGRRPRPLNRDPPSLRRNPPFRPNALPQSRRRVRPPRQSRVLHKIPDRPHSRSAARRQGPHRPGGDRAARRQDQSERRRLRRQAYAQRPIGRTRSIDRHRTRSRRAQRLDLARHDRRSRFERAKLERRRCAAIRAARKPASPSSKAAYEFCKLRFTPTAAQMDDGSWEAAGDDSYFYSQK